ncbi:MAG: ATP-binding protein [Gemmatimonadota bacterium]
MSAENRRHDVVGHVELKERIRDSWRAGRLPQSLLLRGPEGVGKQTLALWIARLVQCRTGDPCGVCRSCLMALKLEHPDIHWHFPLHKPKKPSSRRKLREKLEEARQIEIERRRRHPFQPPEGDGPTGIYLAAVEAIRAEAARRPAMGERAVFVVGRAEAMVSQSANPEAANAFLKLLEEPPPYALLILTTSRPRALLPTIRSRTLSVRVPPLADEQVAAFLEDRLGLDPSQAAIAARSARGSIGLALRRLEGDDAEIRDRAAAFLRAARSPRAADRFRVAASQAAFGARGAFSDTLVQLAELLRDLLSIVAGQPELAYDAAGARRASDGSPPDPEGLIRALQRVEEAQRMAAGNVNPQAISAVLLADLHQALA